MAVPKPDKSTPILEADAKSCGQSWFDFFGYVDAQLKALAGVILSSRVIGTTTNDNAAAGYIGEFVSASVLQASAVALTSGAVANVTSIPLTAGDWDISAGGGFIPAAGTSITRWGCSIETANNTFGSLADRGFIFSMAAVVPGTNPNIMALPTLRVSLAAPATYFLNAAALFSVSTLGAFATIRARRVR